MLRKRNIIRSEIQKEDYDLYTERTKPKLTIDLFQDLTKIDPTFNEDVLISELNILVIAVSTKKKPRKINKKVRKLTTLVECRKVFG